MCSTVTEGGAGFFIDDLVDKVPHIGQALLVVGAVGKCVSRVCSDTLLECNS